MISLLKGEGIKLSAEDDHCFCHSLEGIVVCYALCEERVSIFFCSVALCLCSFWSFSSCYREEFWERLYCTRIFMFPGDFHRGRYLLWCVGSSCCGYISIVSGVFDEAQTHTIQPCIESPVSPFTHSQTPLINFPLHPGGDYVFLLHLFSSSHNTINVTEVSHMTLLLWFWLCVY